MKKVIFLDIDGVLCTEKAHLALRGGGLMQHLDPMSVKLVERLAEESGAEIVLSSTWRRHHDKMSMTAILQNAGFSKPPRWHQNWRTSLNHLPLRGDQIKNWLNENGGVENFKYVILDDTPDMLEEQAYHYIQTNFSEGFSSGDYYRAKKILGVDE